MKKLKLFLLMFVLTIGSSIIPMNVASANERTDAKLSNGEPNEVGIDPAKLQEIDAAVIEAIESGVTPGAVVLVSKDGKIVKEEAYGFAQKYDMGELLKNPRKMKKKTIFDLASVTKVMGTTQGIMKLISDGKLLINDKVSDYIPQFALNGKENITVADLLTHTSGLTPWKPTYLYADNSEEVLDYINQLPLEYPTGTDRRYSDFSFMMLGFLIEEVSGQKLDEFLEENIYSPLNMHDTMFNPADYLNQRIAATSWGNPYEYKMIDDPNFGYYVEESADMFKNWRDYTLVGEVNDGNSFYANEGVAGHAGLFSTARDLATLGQTMLNGGFYGKTKLYDEEVLDAFTSPKRFGQGYGWELNKSWYMGDLYSAETFGHTGFTGTQVIFDPEENLQIILLTNKQNNGPLTSGSYRSTGALSKKVANIVYESLN
ncbi:CubicO group peptidase (beta-lactamase class C family) [Cytobacillus oceanisediminis]|jgi:CubicO group peptidase (beta-lactamase class C family)|uniref:CubicO group peptidase (Beta-lactamase class C family) n=1 Tax=Cytobacillus oceanisediminis TaxID=665099 RepID=A0A2V3A388_9BACI|nr:serine hydrolase [Cytobacillus oceanisediminis]PWW31181.1 CubicO group peptidase (beta-lactamase class C family) [Cytobacillus oceanisediminis]